LAAIAAWVLYFVNATSMSSQEVMPAQAGGLAHADEQLRRVIGPWSLGFTSVNTAIGAGIFVLPGVIAALLGPSAILAYLICGLAVALVLTCFIEIGSFVRRSGGAVAYVEEAFGPMMGFFAWVLYTLGFEIVCSAALGSLLMNEAALVFPPLARGAPRVMAIVLLFGGLAAVNITGVRKGVRFSVGVTITKLLPLLLVVAGGLVIMHWKELAWTGWPPFARLGEASLILFFAFQGSEEALMPSAEIRDPARTVPRAMFGAISALILLFVSIQVVSQGVLGSNLAHQSTAPLAAVAERFAGGAGHTLLLIGVAVSMFGAISGSMTASPRSFFRTAEDGMLPAALARVHPKFRTPHVAIVTVAVLIILLAVTGEFKPLAILSSTSILCVYLAVCLGALRLRYTRKQIPGAFRAPGGPVVGILGAAAVVWLLSHSTRVQVSAVAGLLVLATVYFFARRWILSRSSLSASAAERSA
jgi:basic amino acid/polyamine antiporter, APA family